MPTYTPLQSIQLTEATSSIVFSGIPQIYQDLVLVISNVKHSYAGSTTVRDGFLQFNGDTGNNYSDTILLGDGASASSVRASNQAAIRAYYPMASANPGTIIAHIQNYSNTTTFKTVLYRCSVSDGNVSAIVGLWRNTAAITSFSMPFSGYTLSAGSTFDLYGISPVAATNAQAAGGTDIFYDASYVYHVFKGSGTFTPYRNLTADILVVAGGGGAGSDYYAGGGGAGGLIAHTSQSLTASTAYTVTIGAGGSTASGNNSQFGSLTAAVGGGKGGQAETAGSNGGSGGGGGGGNGVTFSGGTGTSGQGSSGGSGFNQFSNNGSGGGGGGASAAGSNGAYRAGGNGGAGSSAYSSWGAATNTGQLVSGTYYYAGGGGGTGGFQEPSVPSTGGTGGVGGGGTGGVSPNWAGGVSGTAGTTNTGGGAGGNANPNNGGSGIVIVRYAR